MNDETAAAPPALPPMPRNALSDRVEAVREEVSRAFIGQPDVLDQILIALLAGGHVLIEGVPGLGKTLLVRALAQALELTYARVQFTPDLMPSDVSGHAVYDPKTESFQIRRGPVFTHILLADEINRAPAKTQSALLEVMQEGQVTIEGKSFELSPPFIALATQNPVEQEGTYPLPEAQVDRFMLKVKVGYPTREEEKEVLNRMTGEAAPKAQKVISTEQLVSAKAAMHGIYVDEKVKDYILNLVFATREPLKYGLKDLPDFIQYGASPRATIALTQAARGHAFLRHRGFVTPEDVKAIGLDVLRHRISLTYEAEAEEFTPERIIQRVFERVEVP